MHAVLHIIDDHSIMTSRPPPGSFRPCIDLHEGRVKQIVGSTLGSSSADLATNFVAAQPAAWFADLYRSHGLPGGHVVMLGVGCEAAAVEALRAFPGGLQVGGGVNAGNALGFLEAGASHVIVTSWVFREGRIDMERLTQLRDVVGKHRLVIDLSCRKKAQGEGPFFVVTDKWQKFTDFEVSKENLHTLAEYCDEFLVHGVDVEGKRQGIIEELVVLLGECSPIPVTYAGGVRSLADCDLVRDLGKNRVDVSIGSALSIFGGDLGFEEVVKWSKGAPPPPATTSAASSSSSSPKRSRVGAES